MSERLREMVKRRLLELGDNALSRLAVEAGLSATLINNVRNGHIPLPKSARKIALACGASDEEALRLAAECSSERAKESA